MLKALVLLVLSFSFINQALADQCVNVTESCYSFPTPINLDAYVAQLDIVGVPGTKVFNKEDYVHYTDYVVQKTAPIPYLEIRTSMNSCNPTTRVSVLHLNRSYDLTGQVIAEITNASDGINTYSSATNIAFKPQAVDTATLKQFAYSKVSRDLAKLYKKKCSN